MLNFGVLEVANSTVPAAPGWAYVPDVGANASMSALQPSRSKRMRAQIAASPHETTAKQDAKILRELTALDRENHRDVSIPVPVRHRDNAGRVSHGKVTPAVRKILQSQKTFANHLADYEALSVLNSSVPPSNQPVVSSPATPSTPHPPSTSKRTHRKKDAGAGPAPTPLRRVSAASEAATPAPIKSEISHDTPMKDAPILSLNSTAEPPPHPEDNNPLLVSWIPQLPTQEEMEKLLAAPPLSYNDARGPWIPDDMRKPVRHFCDVCGYWGRVRCMRCGGRVCALECLGVHQEECFTRYGA